MYSCNLPSELCSNLKFFLELLGKCIVYTQNNFLHKYIYSYFYNLYNIVFNTYKGVRRNIQEGANCEEFFMFKNVIFQKYFKNNYGYHKRDVNGGTASTCLP